MQRAKVTARALVRFDGIGGGDEAVPSNGSEGNTLATNRSRLKDLTLSSNESMTNTNVLARYPRVTLYRRRVQRLSYVHCFNNQQSSISHHMSTLLLPCHFATPDQAECVSTSSVKYVLSCNIFYTLLYIVKTLLIMHA